MKRCPSCKFIYLDTDEVCDFDGIQLVLVDEKDFERSVAAETTATLARPVKGKSRRTMTLAGVVGIGLAVVMFLVYFAAARRSQSVAQIPQLPVPLATPIQPEPTPTSTPSPSPTVASSPGATERRSDSPAPSTMRANVSKNPVSTSAQTGPQAGALIRLSNGARIEADEVWRTREGVWYRRNGVVTLLSASKIKAIERSSRRD